MNELTSHNEQDVVVDGDAQVRSVRHAFKTVCREAVSNLGITPTPIVEVEIIVNHPNGRGQVEHMDNFKGVWNFFTPLTCNSATTVKVQDYQDFPVNMGPYSSVPQGWANLIDERIEWNGGDLLMMRSNAIHAGPPNGSTRRYVLFAAEESVRGSHEYTDSRVITEREFFSAKKAKTAGASGGGKVV
tara:strand:- start:51 stop:611 length:561 start_codon:yes stop_codon:yes gene_type:complete